MNKRLTILLLLSMIMATGIAGATPKTWNVATGGETPDMAIQGMGFYPGIIIINEGDTINWTIVGSLAHTVSFLSGAQPPAPGSPQSLTRSGNPIYNGTGVVSSGILTPGTNYSLKFTTAGNYSYGCLIHPGMAGLVIVQKANSTYPFNQSQYIIQGKQELQADLDAGQKLANNVTMTTSSGPNNTSVFHVLADIPTPMTTNVVLAQVNKSHVNGSATLAVDVGKLQVDIQVSGLVPNSTNSALISIGTSATGGQILYSLSNIRADRNGTGSNKTNITGPAWFAIASKGWFIDVRNTNGTSIARGDIVMYDTMYARFTPRNLVIHTGDTVEWTELNPMEIHTVTFGNNTIELLLPNLTINPVVATPAGGNIHNGTGFYNSGILGAGNKYSLTFTKPGNYSYVCIIHDDIGMAGNITVLNKTVVPTTPVNPVITNFVVTPNTAISKTNPAIASANIVKGANDIKDVEFGIIDVNNLTGVKGNGSTILSFTRNFSKVEGLYKSDPWSANFATIGNTAVSDTISVYTASDAPGSFLVRGTFRQNNTSDETEALGWFNRTTLNLSKVTAKRLMDGNATIMLDIEMNIENGNSTFKGKTFRFINGAVSNMPESHTIIFKLYNVTGNLSSNNPRLAFKNVPQGKYKAYVIARDSEGNNTTIVTDIDTIPVSTTPSGSSGGGSTGGGSGGGYNSQGNGTIPSKTPTQPTTATTTPVETTITPKITVSIPEKTAQQTEKPTTIPTKSPGFEIAIAIGAMLAIYIIARKRR